MEPNPKESNQMLQHYRPEQEKLIASSKTGESLLNKRPKLTEKNGESKISMPKKGKYRMRAHCNPLSDTAFPFPLNPNYVDWSMFYPKFFQSADVKSSFFNIRYTRIWGWFTGYISAYC